MATTIETAMVGQPAPDFDMASTKNIEKLNENVKLSDYKGKWLVLLFYPLDFTFVCPTELTTFSDRYEDFEGIGADVIGVSTDSVFSHRAWQQTARDKGGVEGLLYPLAADQTKEVSRAYGVLIENQGVALRGLFVIDPEGVLRYAVVHDRTSAVRPKKRCASYRRCKPAVSAPPSGSRVRRQSGRQPKSSDE